MWGELLPDLMKDAGYEVRVFDNLLYEETYRKPVYFVRGDIRERERLLPHLQWADL